MHAALEFDSESLKPNKHLDILAQNLPSFARDFKLLTPDETKFLRKRSQELVREFRRAHDKEYGIKGFFEHYEVHHIVPLSLGGGITSANLSFVDHDFHAAIHRYINRQMRGMNFGEVRTINIPFVPSTIWHRPQIHKHTPHSVMKTVIPRYLTAHDYLAK
jgi:hypothetical protein